MTVYEYRCEGHGRFDVRAPFGGAPESPDCPWCGVPAARRWSGVPLLGAHAARSAVIEHCARSAEEPEVVTQVPGRSGRGGGSRAAAPLHPATRALPRP